MLPDLEVQVRPREEVHALDRVLEGAKAGDEAAFRALVEAISPGVTQRLVRGLCRDDDTASGVLQDTWMAAWGRMLRFASYVHLVRWIHRVATNKAISVLRRARRERRAIGVVAEGSQVLYSRHGERARFDVDPEDATRLWDAVKRLPGPYRSLAALLHRRECTVSQCARLLGISVPAMKMRMHRLRGLLRDGLHFGSGGDERGQPHGEKGKCVE